MSILIYVDEGVSGEALRQTVKSLQNEVDLSAHPLIRKDSQQILSQDWEKDTKLLLIPGGRDVYYHKALGKKGAEKIRAFIENGGHYLGLCAGAYFAAQKIEFEKGGPLQVCGERALSFFPGRAAGPAYGPGRYSYESDQGVEAACISWKSEECFTYFNGGCYFEDAHAYSGVEVLGSYLQLEQTPAAIVSCRVGEGKAILSGVHIEFTTAFLQRGSRHLAKVLPSLEETEEKRRMIFRSILKELGVKVREL